LLRGGKIIARKEKVKPSSGLMKWDPLTLVVCLDESECALGSLYVDDGFSFEFEKGNYIFNTFEFKNNQLTSKMERISSISKIHGDSILHMQTRIEKIIVLGLSTPRKITLRDSRVNFAITNSKVIIHLEKHLKTGQDWVLSFY
jgi:alpha 1,3-glucosidase